MTPGSWAVLELGRAAVELEYHRFGTTIDFESYAPQNCRGNTAFAGITRKGLGKT